MEEDKEEFNETDGVEIPGGQEGQEGQVLGRVRLPRGKEVLGRIEQRLGASRMMVKCFDGKTRNCRVPGRLKRRLWLRENDVVLVEPWELGGEVKGDILLKYSQAQVDFLRKKGFLKAEL